MKEDQVLPKIIFEDEQLLVLDKPAGMVVNRSETTASMRTVQDFVEEHFPHHFLQEQRGEGTVDEAFYARSGIVHRLDKETSGVLLVAKTVKTFYFLQEQFKERRIQKTYIALVHEFVKPATGEINVPVGRLPWNRKQFGIVAGGRESVTTYKALSYYQFIFGKEMRKLSLLELYPKTGRTHQIRVHLKYINHPIFSDYLYAGRKTAREDRNFLSRVFLHAKALTVSLASLETKTFVSELPLDLNSFLQQLTQIDVADIR